MDKEQHNNKEQQAQQDLLEIKRLLTLNSEGVILAEDRSRLLRLMEQYFLRSREDRLGAQEGPGNQEDLPAADFDQRAGTSENVETDASAHAAQAEVVFKAFMDACWASEMSLKATPATADLISGDAASRPTPAQNKDGVDWERMYKEVTGAATDVTAVANNTDNIGVSDNIVSGPRHTHLSECEGDDDDVVVDERAAGKIRKIGAQRFNWVAAAIILVVIGAGIGSWWLYQRNAGNTDQASLVNTATQDLHAPAGAHAVLILSDGRRVVLDSALAGQHSTGNLIASDGHATVALGGKNDLNYSKASVAVGIPLQYNELRVLKGSQPVAVRLPDGTKVWINVGSSLKYPTAFALNKREVILNGEAYFEVDHESKRPFIVHHSGLEVTVLGTHFNINSYTDEPDIKVTLMEGAVAVTSKQATLTLHPGQQAVASTSGGAATGTLALKQHADLEQVISWKSSAFVFGDESDFKGIMRQIARWYNVNVVYEGVVDTKFWGSVSKTSSIKEVLQVLEATGGVRFHLTGNTLHVIPVQ